jgi:hypothetical protein
MVEQQNARPHIGQAAEDGERRLELLGSVFGIAGQECRQRIDHDQIHGASGVFLRDFLDQFGPGRLVKTTAERATEPRVIAKVELKVTLGP